MTANDVFSADLPLIEERLKYFFSENNGRFSSAGNAAAYSLLSGGKRIRPVLLLEFYKLCGGKGTGAADFAAAIEMVHTYSLVHDDLPCMDNDDMRRGKPSCHKAFGEDIALLAGDALLTRAFEAAALTEGAASEAVLRAIAVLAEKAGISGMIKGQVMDLMLEKSPADGGEIKDMYLNKTSCLLEAAAMCGCILAGADSRCVSRAERYAAMLGLAFQIIDDILDCTSDEKILGKPIGSDRKNGKTTYVSLYGLDKARAEAERLSLKAEKILCEFEGDVSALRALTEYLLDRKY